MFFLIQSMCGTATTSQSDNLVTRHCSTYNLWGIIYSLTWPCIKCLLRLIHFLQEQSVTGHFFLERLQIHIHVFFNSKACNLTISITLSVGSKEAHLRNKVKIWTNLMWSRPPPAAVCWPRLPSKFSSPVNPPKLLFLFHGLCPLSTSPSLSVSPSFHSPLDSHAFPFAQASRQCHSPRGRCWILPRPLALSSDIVFFWPGVYRIEKWRRLEWGENIRVKAGERNGNRWGVLGGCRPLKIIPGSFLLKRQDFSGIMYLKNLLTWPLVFTVDNIWAQIQCTWRWGAHFISFSCRCFKVQF